MLQALCVHERPTQRIRTTDPKHLTSVELVAALLQPSRKFDSLRLAQEVLAKHDGQLRRLKLTPIGELAQLVGRRNADRLVAGLNLGLRAAAEIRDDGAPIRSPRDAVTYYAPKLEDLPVEEFHVAILDAQHRLERDVTVTRGILNSSLVHPREVFREAIAERAAAVILVHNHPSGDPTPSADDRAVTDQLVAAGRLLDIPVHDHVIIGRGRYTSFTEAGLL